MVAKIDGMLPDRDGKPLGTMFRHIPMGDEPYDFAANFRFGDGSKDIQGGHSADHTGNRRLTQ